ncbi:hypothetical protein [Sphingomonas sp. ABOLF]|uniref:hypothetical protein n=1 Tax=Sphingomonas sp. ABOLF TaxID=1985879 RepID=UPI000F7ED5C3|nr:hypothetical protein [Sphingomonas sp. ABOLF]
MDGYEFTAALVSSLAWPLGAVGITAMLRRPISGLLSRAKSGEIFGAKLEFGEAVEAIREVVENTPPQIPPPDALPVQPSADVGSETITIERFPTAYSEELALTSATGSIAIAWKELESSLHSIALAVGAKWHPGNIPANLRRLEAHGVISEETANAISNLRALRNQVVHSKEAGVTLSDAANYRETVNSILANLDATRFAMGMN